MCLIKDYLEGYKEITLNDGCCDLIRCLFPLKKILLDYTNHVLVADLKDVITATAAA